MEHFAQSRQRRLRERPSPSPGVYNIYAAAGESKTARDRPNYIYDTAWKRIVRAIGFKTADESAISDEYRIFFNDQAALQSKRQDAIDDYIDAYEDKDTATMKKLAPRLAKLGVTRRILENEWQRKHQTRGERLEGNIIPKRQQAEYRRRFVNFAKPD